MGFSPPRRGPAVSTVVLGLCLGFAGVVHANLRAPAVVRAQPSSAPSKPEGQFTVLGETLRFECSEHQCLVEARYRIRSARAASAVLSFVLPSNALAATASARLGEQALEFRESPLTQAQRAGLRRTEDAAGFSEWVAQDPSRRESFELQLAQGEFEVPFEPGENLVAVRYVQPLGSQERDYGYFKAGRFLKTFRYELWPLKEWALDAHFALDVRVTAPRRAPGYFQRKLGTVASIACGPGADALRRPVEVVQEGDRMVYAATLGPEFPGHLFCSIGDEDILPHW